MPNQAYWARFTEGRMSRRRILAEAGLAGAAAAALSFIGCGGGSKGTGSNGDAASLLAKPAETKAVKGGVYPISLAADPVSFAADAGAGALQALHAYSRLVKFRAFRFPAVPEALADPDAAASWEVAPDGLTATYKIRPNVKLDSRQPTNGRVLNSGDVVFSWKKFETVNGQRLNLANSVNPAAAVISVSAPDSSTAVFKLAFPYSPLNAMLAFYRHLPIYPVEYDGGGYDPRNDMRGSSAWRLKSYQGSVSIEYQRNPDWYDADKVNPDSIIYHIIPEYATGLSQFRAGALATFAVNPEDILATKRDLPQLLLFANDSFALGAYQYRFSYLPGSPFFDDRVRKALSMLYNRDQVVDVFGNVEEFRKAGIPVKSRWNSIVPGGYDQWLDPTADSFGPSAKWYKYDPAGAKQLMRAAGFTSALETQFTYTDLKKSGSVYQRKQEVIAQMWQEFGDFKLKTATPDYDSIYRNTYHYGRDKVEGLFVGQSPGSTPEIDNWLTGFVQSNNDQTGHLDSPGKPPADIDSLIDKQRTELDPNKRKEIIYDIQRKFADKMYVFLEAGSTQTFSLGWPWIGNWQVFRAFDGGVPAIETIPTSWIDRTKKT